MSKKPYYFGEKPPKCLYCRSTNTKFEYTSHTSAIGNVPLDQPQDWYRCTKCFRMTPIG